jgi:hypothetical protein
MNKTCLIVFPLLLAGCNAAPLDYTPIGDMKSGPGMFSGADGGYVMRAKGNTAAPAAADPVPASQAKPVAPSLSAEEYREFQEWREWRRAREGAAAK